MIDFFEKSDKSFESSLKWDWGWEAGMHMCKQKGLHTSLGNLERSPNLGQETPALNDNAECQPIYFL